MLLNLMVLKEPLLGACLELCERGMLFQIVGRRWLLDLRLWLLDLSPKARSCSLPVFDAPYLQDRGYRRAI
jgi:hypothetical protein